MIVDISDEKTLAEKCSFSDNLTTLTIFNFPKINKYSEINAATVDTRHLRVKVAE